MMMFVRIEEGEKMIQYIRPENVDDRILESACQKLREGELIAIPSDTNWIVLCDPSKKLGVQKLYQLKNEDKIKHFSLICDSLKTANDIAVIDSQTFRIMKRLVPGHYTFILPARKSIMKSLKASKSDHEVGVRIIPIDWINKLIEYFGEPLLSTNLNNQLLNIDEDDEVYGILIDENLNHEISLVIDPGECNFVGQSTILNFAKDEADPLERIGAGPWP